MNLAIITSQNSVEWIDSISIHQNLNNWISELEFYKSKHLFCINLLRSYKLNLIDNKKFKESIENETTLKDLVFQNQILKRAVINGRHILNDMINNNHMPQNLSFLEFYKELSLNVNKYIRQSRMARYELFTLLKDVMTNRKMHYALKN